MPVSSLYGCTAAVKCAAYANSAPVLSRLSTPCGSAKHLRGGMAAGESDEVPLAVADEGHPLLEAGYAEDAVSVGVDHVGLTLDLHASCRCS